MTAVEISTRRLEGIHVLLTRPRERAEDLCFVLEDEGAEVTSVPLLELVPPEDVRPLRAAAEQVHRFAWVIFASPSSVQAMVEATREAGTFDRLVGLKFAAVGPGTATACEALGLSNSVQPSVNSGQGLADALKGKLYDGDEVLLPVAQDGRRELHDALDASGAAVSRVVAYRSLEAPVDEACRQALREHPPDVIVFASPRTVEAFLRAFEADANSLMTRSKMVAIGPTTAKALTALELTVAAIAQAPTTDGLLEAVVAAARA